MGTEAVDSYYSSQPGLVQVDPDDNLPTKVQMNIPHVQQGYSWDCGLACAQMILRHFARDCSNFETICKNLKFGTSVWTIDLAHLMVLFDVKHLFCTITLGVDKGYSNKVFYRAHFDRDEVRVNDLFTNHESLDISLEKKSLSLTELIYHLSQENLLVSLVDWSYLSCIWCDRRCLPSMSCLGKCLKSYQGHFVVVVGYNLTENLIYYKNPSYQEALCCCSMEAFETARKSYGTDEDTLLIFKDS